MYDTVNDNLLVLLDSDNEELMNGLHVESSVASRRKIVNGSIVSTGELNGRTIYFPMYAADEIFIKGEKFLVVNYNDVKVLV